MSAPHEMISQESVQSIASLHSLLTSSRGDFFRKKLLQDLRMPKTTAEVSKKGHAIGLEETRRHVNKLIQFKFVEESGNKLRRTPLGEEALNTVKELERKIGMVSADRIYAAALGPNSITLFFHLYHSIQVATPVDRIGISANDLGQMTTKLFYGVDRAAVMDKLLDSGLLVYEPKRNVFLLDIRQARSVYAYLQALDVFFKKIFPHLVVVSLDNDLPQTLRDQLD